MTSTPTAVVHLLALLSATLGLALSPAEDIGNIDAYVRSQMDAAQVPGLALGVVQGDRVLRVRGFGAADDSGRAVTPQTPFNIGSVTKSFTAMAVMQLVEKGQITLGAPIQQYLPWFRLAGGAASSVATEHTGSHNSLASGYGMGWVVGTSLGAPLIWHNGDDSYFHSEVRMAPRQQLEWSY